MTNCIWVNQYVRQDGVTVRSHQRCYSKPLTKADKASYDKVSGDAQRRWDDYRDTEREAEAYNDLLRDAQERNSPLIKDIQKNRGKAYKKVFRELDGLKAASKRKRMVEQGLGISDDPGAMEFIDPQGQKMARPKGPKPPIKALPSSPSPIQASPSQTKRARRSSNEGSGGSIGLVQGLIGRRGSTGRGARGGTTMSSRGGSRGTTTRGRR